MAQTIHLVFKTHLDIGFTDHAAMVRAQYHERFIPQALDTAEHFHAEDPEHPKFVWTTGAWLIWDHLETQGAERRERLERAIQRGLIRWHALPFTTHSELMSPALFRAGLSVSQELDQRFGVTTCAAKMTDVPGHTRGIVPLLAEAGVRFLHLGVNTASPVPDVPDVFRWRVAGSEVVVMYQDSYGGTHFPRGFADGISFAHTSDNMGPQSVPQVADVYRAMAHRYPNAAVRAAALEDYGALLWDRRAEFPVVDVEIGDSWIFGAASDPIKVQRFLALQRLYDRFAAEALTPERRAFGRGLTLIPEHTWGVDIKSYLRDDAAWDRDEYEAARAGDHRFAYAEASWAEQRGYLDAAVAELEPDDRTRAEAELNALAVPAAPTPSRLPVAGALAVGGWTVNYDPETGDVSAITAPRTRRIAGPAGTLLGLRHESYDAADVARHIDTYLTHREEWAILDHGKPGLEHARTARSAVFVPGLVGVGADALMLAFEPEARERLGAPASAELRFEARDEALEITVVLRGKPANRMPEAGFLVLTPAGVSGWDYRKMGLWAPGDRVARRGGGQLQAVSAARGGSIEFTPLDTPLVAPTSTPFMGFDPEPPDLSRGLRFTLYNNKWGTNFPMWWEGDLAARFVVRIIA
jgi:hypothetical protein